MWLKRGCCGLFDLKTQTLAIAVLYTFIALVGIIYGFVMIHSPAKVFGASHAVEEVIKEEIDTNTDDDDVAAGGVNQTALTKEIENGTISPQDHQHYEEGLLRTQKKGIERKYQSLGSMSSST